MRFFASKIGTLIKSRTHGYVMFVRRAIILNYNIQKQIDKYIPTYSHYFSGRLVKCVEHQARLLPLATSLAIAAKGR
jgi:hypothetical protein